MTRQDHVDVWTDAMWEHWFQPHRSKWSATTQGRITTTVHFINASFTYERSRVTPSFGGIYSSSPVIQCGDCSRTVSEKKARRPCYRTFLHGRDDGNEFDHNARYFSRIKLCNSCWMKEYNIEKRARAVCELETLTRKMKHEIAKQNRNSRSASPVSG